MLVPGNLVSHNPHAAAGSVFYTGIGSRSTPDNIQKVMFGLAEDFAIRGFVLRSGGAPGADSVFEEGAGDCGKQIYLPWPRFNDNPSPRVRPSTDAYKMAKTAHPAWEALSGGARALHARNCHQVLGDDLRTPSAFLICWTPDGCESEAQRTKETGGTGTAIVIANRHDVPVFNLQSHNDVFGRLQSLLNSISQRT